MSKHKPSTQWIIKENPPHWVSDPEARGERYDRFISLEDSRFDEAVAVTDQDLLALHAKGLLTGRVLTYVEDRLLRQPTYIIVSDDWDEERHIPIWTRLWRGTWKNARASAGGEVRRVSPGALRNLHYQGATDGELEVFVKQNLVDAKGFAIEPPREERP